jgi:hypothetical protein
VGTASTPGRRPSGPRSNTCCVAPFPDQPTIGWTSSAGNLQYLAPALAEILRIFPEAEIEVCCDGPPDLARATDPYVHGIARAKRILLVPITVEVMPLSVSAASAA